MSQAFHSVVAAGPVIVSPKKPPEQVKFRWDPDLIEEIRVLADRTHRTINETGEKLMRFAVERAKADLETASVSQAERRKK